MTPWFSRAQQGLLPEQGIRRLHSSGCLRIAMSFGLVAACGQTKGPSGSAPEGEGALMTPQELQALPTQAADERGAYLRILSHDVSQVGAVLFGSGVVVDELTTERRDLEQEFFSMLEHSR